HIDYQTAQNFSVANTPDAHAQFGRNLGMLRCRPIASRLRYLCLIAIVSGCGQQAGTGSSSGDVNYGSPEAWTDFGYHVGVVGTDTSGDGAAAGPWRSIQYGIDHVASDNGRTPTLHVAAGTYDGKLTISKPISIVGAGSDAVSIRNTADSD